LLTPRVIHKNRRKKSSTNAILLEFLRKPYVGIADPQWNSTIGFKCIEELCLDKDIFNSMMGAIKVPRGRPQWNSNAQVPEIMPELKNRDAEGRILFRTNLIARGKQDLSSPQEAV
jgi:hypothetical protein